MNIVYEVIHTKFHEGFMFAAVIVEEGGNADRRPPIVSESLLNTRVTLHFVHPEGHDAYVTLDQYGSILMEY